MYEDHAIGVVIPAYNEEGFVGEVIRNVPPYVDRVYVVDDCSTDDTWTEIAEAARLDARVTERRDGVSGGRRGTSAGQFEQPWPGDDGHDDAAARRIEERAIVGERVDRVVPIRHERNRGAGGAIKTGYLACLAGGVDIAVTIDGDGQMDTSLLPRLLDPIADGRAEYAKGTRLLDRDARREMPRFRAFGNFLLTLLTKTASGYWGMTDPQNGYTAISRRALEQIRVEELYEYYGYCNELLVRLNVNEVPIADVEIPARYGGEESHIEYGSYVPKVSTMLLRNFLWRLETKYVVRDFHPLVVLYALGVGGIGIGALRTIAAFVSDVDRSESTERRSVLLPALIGFLSTVLTIVCDREESRNLETTVRFR